MPCSLTPVTHDNPKGASLKIEQKEKLKQFSQKWKMNFGKSDALNSGDCCWLYYFSKETRDSLEGNKIKIAKARKIGWKALFKWQKQNIYEIE